MSAKTVAQSIATLLKDDGMCWRAEDGRTLDEIAEELGGRKEKRDSFTYRWDFRDESRLTVCGAAWDFGYPDCFCWAGEGSHAPDCAASIERGDIEALSITAGQAGDLEQVAICNEALTGKPEAWKECVRVILDGRAQ